MAYLRHHRDRLGLGAAADGEGAGDRPAFDSGNELWGFAGSHFKIWQFLNARLARRNQLWLLADMFYKAIAAHWNLSPPMSSGEAAQELAA
jgi:hypothetical protein